MIRKSLTVFGCSGLVLLVGGCPLLELQVETHEVCLHYDGLEVPAADGSGKATLSFVFDESGDGGLGALAQLDGHIAFVRVDVTAASGVSDLAFLTAAKATVAGGDPYDPLPAATIVDCRGDECPHDGATISIPADADVDALPYLRTSSVAITLDVEGTLPTVAWTANVDVCVDGAVSYTPQI